MTAAGGHAFTYADSEDSLPSVLICAVCHDVCGTHSACPRCSQTFCEVCVHKWFNVQRNTGAQCTCPYCRHKLRFSDLTHDPAIQQQLEQLSVLCPHAPAGCPAVQPRAELPAHLQNSCMFQEVSCRFCGLVGRRAHIQQHQAHSCSKRLVPCTHAAAGCEAQVPKDAVLQHLELNCSYAPKPCKSCGQQVPRVSWSEHLQHGCPAQLPCPLRLYGCCFSGDSAAVAAHLPSCPYQQHKQQLQAQVSQAPDAGAVGAGTAGAGASAAADAGAAAAAAAGLDPGEHPAGSVDVAASFNAASALLSNCQAHQALLDSFPNPGPFPPRLQQPPQPQQQQPLQPPQQQQQQQPAQQAPQQQWEKILSRRQRRRQQQQQQSLQQQQQSPQQPPQQPEQEQQPPQQQQPAGRSDTSSGLLLQRYAATAVSVQQLSEPMPPRVFLSSQGATAGNTLAATATATATGSSTCTLPHNSSNSSSSSSSGVNCISSCGSSPADLLALGAPGCLAALGLEGDPLCGAAWRIVLNLTVAELLKDQESASEELLSPFMLYSSICRAWDTVEAFVQGLPTADGTQQQQQQARVTSSTSAGDNGSLDQRELTGVQLWRQWLPGRNGSSSSPGRHSSDGNSSSSGSSRDGSRDGRDWGAYSPDDGLPGIQRGLFLDEHAALERCLYRGEGSSQLLTAASAAASAVASWIGFGGALFWPPDAEHLEELVRESRVLVDDLQYKLAKIDMKRQLRQLRKRDREGDAGTEGPDEGAVADSVRGRYGLMAHEWEEVAAAAGLKTGAAQQDQQQAAGVGQRVQRRPLHPVIGGNFAVVQQHLLQAANGAEVGSGSTAGAAPAWLSGLQPLVAAELGSALLVLHEVRADHGEMTLTPDINKHLGVGYRAFWAPSVLAGAKAWLGPGFRLAWQSVAVLSDILVAFVDKMTLVLGETFYDHNEERVPLSPELVMDAAALVLPPGLLEAALSHLMRLSAAHQDLSCEGEDLSRLTWEQFARKLGLVMELDKMVCIVREQLPVMYNEDEEGDEDEEEEDEDEDDEDEYETDDDEEESDEEGSSYDPDPDYMMRYGSSGDGSSSGEGSYDSDGNFYWHSSADGSSNGAEGSSGGTASGSGSEWESIADEEEAAALEQQMNQQQHGNRGTANRSTAGAAAASSGAAGGAAGAGAAGAAAPNRRRQQQQDGAAGAAAPSSAGGGDAAEHMEQGDAEVTDALDASTEATAAAAATDWRWQWEPALRDLSVSTAAAAATAAKATTTAAAAAAGHGAVAAAGGPAPMDVDASFEQQLQQHQQQQQQQLGPYAQQLLHELCVDLQTGFVQGGRETGGVEANAAYAAHVCAANAARGLDAARAAAAAAAAAAGANPSDPAAAAAANVHGSSSRQQQQQQRQQHQQQQHRPSEAEDDLEETDGDDEDSEGEGWLDACIHGEVLLLGLCEVVLQMVLLGAAWQAAADPEQLSCAGTSACSAGASAAAGTEAAPAGAGAGAAAAASGGGDEEAVQKAFAEGRVLLPGTQPRVVVTPKHLQLAIAGYPDLAAALLQGRPGVPQPAACAWAGGGPTVDPRLKPDPLTVGVAALLLTLAEGSWQQQQQQQPPPLPPQQQQPLKTTSKQQTHKQKHKQQPKPQSAVASGSNAGSSGGGNGSSSGCLFVYPADLRVYCGVTLSAPPAAVPSAITAGTVLSRPTNGQAAGAAASAKGPGAGATATATGAAGAASAAGAAEHAAANAAAAGLLEGPAVTCCYMSGWQCSSCAAQTEALAAAGLEAQLDACQKGLVHALQQQQQQQQQQSGVLEQQQPGCEGDNNLSVGGTEEAVQQLMRATRLYHLQQPWWYGSDAGSSDGCRNGSSDDCMAEDGCSMGVSEQQQQGTQHMDAIDRAQLQQLQALLQPLRDVVALREVHVQQQQAGYVLPKEAFKHLADDVLCEVLMQRRQQEQQREEVRQQLGRLLGPSAAAAAAGAASSAAEAGPRQQRWWASSISGSGGSGAQATSSSAAAAAAAIASCAAEGGDASGEAVCEEWEFDAGALDLLQQAAEGFVVQQLSGANNLALHAGRQDIRPEDLRLALLASGYGHLVPRAAGAVAAAAGGHVGGAGGAAASGLHNNEGSGGSKRRKGAPGGSRLF